MKDNLDILLKIFGVIGGLVGAYVFIKKSWKAHVTKRNHFYSGNWNNQGQIENLPSHYVDLDGRASENKFKGNFNVRKWDDENSWEMFTLKGKIYFGKLRCKLIKIEDGKEKLVAVGILTKRKTILAWKLIRTDSNKFPKEAVLRKGFSTLG